MLVNKLKKRIIKALGGSSKEELQKAKKIARKASLEKIAFEEENKNLKADNRILTQELVQVSEQLEDAHIKIQELEPGYSVDAMQKYIKEVNSKSLEKDAKILELKKQIEYLDKRIESRDVLIGSLSVKQLNSIK